MYKLMFYWETKRTFLWSLIVDVCFDSPSVFTQDVYHFPIVKM